MSRPGRFAHFTALGLLCTPLGLLCAPLGLLCTSLGLFCTPPGAYGAPPAVHNDATAMKSASNTNSSKGHEQAVALLKQARELNRILESEEALELIKKATVLDPHYELVHLVEAEVYCALGENDKAFKDFEIASRSKDQLTFIDAIRGKSALLFSLKRYDEAIGELDKLFKAGMPISDGVYELRANCYLAEGKLAPALADLGVALKRRPADGNLMYLRARAYILSHQYEKALADYNALINLTTSTHELNVGLPNIYLERAKTYDLLGKGQLARLDRATAAKIDQANLQNAPFRSDKKSK